MEVLTELIRVINMVINMVPNMIRMDSFENKEVILKAAFLSKTFLNQLPWFDKFCMANLL